MTQSDDKEKKDVKVVSQKKPTKHILEIYVNTNFVKHNGIKSFTKKPCYTQGGEVFIPLSTLQKIFPDCEKNGVIKLEVNNG